MLKLAIKQVVDRGYKGFAYGESVHVLVNQMSPIDRQLKINGLRPILRYILGVMAAREKKQPHA